MDGGCGLPRVARRGAGSGLPVGSAAAPRIVIGDLCTPCAYLTYPL